MGLLFSRLWRLFGDEEHKVLILGLDNAGKTTILYQFTMKEVVHTTPTIGSNVEEVRWKNLRFVMWDLAGQDSLRPSWTSYYTSTEFLILVVDCMDRERVGLVKDELYRMLEHEELKKANVLVLANKQDLKGAMSAAELSSLLNLTSIKSHRWQIQACCALTGDGEHSYCMMTLNTDCRANVFDRWSKFLLEICHTSLSYLLRGKPTLRKSVESLAGKR